MEVYALVGASGTGKSHRAQLVAQEYAIPAIIDDGLLIYQGQIVAGKSAKSEPTAMQAVRRAIFVDPLQVREVQGKLAHLLPDSLLIIGTSANMVARIISRLEVPQPREILSISQFATPEEIARARRMRSREGKHVIPVPAIEVKRKIPGFLVDPLQIFFPRRKGRRHVGFSEKSLVRPAFSFVGTLYISDAVVSDLVRYTLQQFPAVTRVVKLNTRDRGGSGVVLDLDLVAGWGFPLHLLLRQVQEQVHAQVEYYTGLYVAEVNVTIKGLAPAPDRSAF